MILVIDFNGYLNSKNKFIIKEYSFYIINNRGNIKTIEFGIVLPDIKDLNYLDSKSKENYEIYYQKYGIKWTTGTKSESVVVSSISYHIPKCHKIFLADNEKKSQLINFITLKKTPEADYVSLKSLGYEMNFINRTNCRYHQSPSSNNCAKENVVDMVAFVKDKKLHDKKTRANLYSIIDFNCFEYENHSIIKEVSISHNSIDEVVTSRDLFVVQPISGSHSGPGNYNEYYQRYGIKWKVGNQMLQSLYNDLSYILKRSIRTYVKNKTQKSILWRLSNQAIENKIICLDKLGYDVGNTEVDFTTCEWHDNKMRNNCADDNVTLMTDWLFQKNLLKVEISHNLQPEKLKENFKTFPYVEYKGPEYLIVKPEPAVRKRNFDNLVAPTASRYYEAFGSMVPSTDQNKRRKTENRDNTQMINKSHETGANNIPRLSQAYVSRKIPSVGKAATSTSPGGKHTIGFSLMSPASRYYDAFALESSSTNQANEYQEIQDDDNDVFKMASELGIEIEDNDDNAFDLASELGIEVREDNPQIMNETVAPNVPRYYQAHGSRDFRINQTKEQTNYDESFIDTVLELESETSKHMPRNIDDSNLESIYKYLIDDLPNESYGSNEFNDLLVDNENDNHRSKFDVDQRHDRSDEKLLSGSVFDNPNNLFDDYHHELNDFNNNSALVYPELKSDDKQEDNIDLENQIFDEKLIDTYIFNNLDSISIDEDEFYDILGLREL